MKSYCGCREYTGCTSCLGSRCFQCQGTLFGPQRRSCSVCLGLHHRRSATYCGCREYIGVCQLSRKQVLLDEGECLASTELYQATEEGVSAQLQHIKQALRKTLWVQAENGRYKLSRKQVLADHSEEQRLQVGYIGRCQAPSCHTDMDLSRKATHLAQIKLDKGDRLGSHHFS